MNKLDSQKVFLFKTLRLVFFLLWVLFPSQLHAATINVGPGESHKTIQSALNDAQPGDTIFVEIGTYAENVVLQDGITIEGEQTAGSQIVGTGISGSTVTISGNGTISNMTIINTVTGSAAVSISSNVAGVTVANNLIIGSSTGTGSAAVSVSFNVTGVSVTNNLIIGSNIGIQCASPSTLTIINNTIDRNTTGITCAGPATITFENNIVSNNTTGINFPSSITVAGDFNDVYNNGSNLYQPGQNDFDSDPKFADRTVNDYHLQTGSACLDAGDPATSFNDKEVLTSPVDYSQNDCGAYGGPTRDTAPFQAQNVAPTTPAPDTIDLNWDANLAYNTDNYKIYFDNQSHTITNNVPSPPYRNTLKVAATTTNCPSTPAPPVCTATISGLTPPAPNLQVTFGDKELFLNWSLPSTNYKVVTSYNIYYMEQGGAAWTTISVGNVTSYTLTGLTNLTTYNVKVTAVALPTYYINVTTLDNFTTPHESDLLDPEKGITINGGTASESPDSNIASGTPEPIAPFPDLPDQGHCFIATAAYGSSLEPHVKVLRAFRDEYLEQYDLGRKFIAWYYRAGPPWAQYLNEHDGLKPVVRIALIPAVAVAYFFVAATEIEKLLIFLLAMLCLLGGMFVMRKTARSRG